MPNNARSSKMNLLQKLTVLFIIITLAAVLIAEGLVWTIALAVGKRETMEFIVWNWRIALVAVFAAAIGGLLGMWAVAATMRRLRRMLDICRAWLRGNLTARITDPLSDDLGLLAGQMDLLAEHLEQDEQDLSKLREHNSRLADQVRALAVVEERNRLARELHDSVKQYLFSLAMTAGGLRARFEATAVPGLATNGENEIVEMVREVETTAQAAQREITRLIKDLRPGSLEEQRLASALNDYTLLFGAREHVLAYLDVQGNDALLPPSVAKALYRIAQEALHNVARHAHATRVDVRLRCLPEQAILTVRDNGIGFDTQQAHQGLGMANMQERMLVLGGQVTVESKPGMGTTVQARIALAHPLDAHAQVIMPVQDRPKPQIENWGWLGQRLDIPVGQTWPWLPADQAHLRQPLVEPGETPLLAVPKQGFLGFTRYYVFTYSQQQMPLIRIRHTHSGYEWRWQGARWALHYVGSTNRMVLQRNGQPLAAAQSQGRLMNTWGELVYDGRGYRLSCAQDRPGSCILTDEAGEEILSVERNTRLQIRLRRALPLSLLVMVALHSVEETGLAPVIARKANS